MGPAGPGPARDRPLVLVQQLRVPLRAYVAVSSAAALTIISTVALLFLTVINRNRGNRPAGTDPRAGGQDEMLLLLGLLLSSSSVLLSGLDAASLSNWTSQLLCSVSPHIQGRVCVLKPPQDGPGSSTATVEKRGGPSGGRSGPVEGQRSHLHPGENERV